MENKEIRNPVLVIHKILEVVPADSKVSLELEIFKKKWNTNFRYTPPEYLDNRYIECFYHLSLLLSAFMENCTDVVQDMVEKIIKNQ